MTTRSKLVNSTFTVGVGLITRIDEKNDKYNNCIYVKVILI